MSEQRQLSRKHLEGVQLSAPGSWRECPPPVEISEPTEAEMGTEKFKQAVLKMDRVLAAVAKRNRKRKGCQCKLCLQNKLLNKNIIIDYSTIAATLTV